MIELNDFTEKIIEKYGKRVEDGECQYCGNPVNGYCNCNGALKINQYWIKAYKKCNEIDNLKVIHSSDDSPEAGVRSCFKIKVPKIFEGMTFEDYKTQGTDKPEKERVLNAVVNYYANRCMNFLEGNNLLLLGKSGTGKTMLMTILANLLAKDCFSVLFVNFVELFENLKETFYKESKISTKEFVDIYRKADFLFIDDLDKKKPAEYTKEILYAIVNYRVENRLATIFSANSDLKALDEMFGEVITSRIAQNATAVLFTHKNERLI